MAKVQDIRDLSELDDGGAMDNLAMIKVIAAALSTRNKIKLLLTNTYCFSADDREYDRNLLYSTVSYGNSPDLDFETSLQTR